MITRASNATKHPGKVVINNGTRRPKEVVQAERASKAAEKKKNATAAKEGIDEVARIENEARKKKDLGPQAGQRSQVTIPRVTRARKPIAATPVDQDDDRTVQVEPQPAGSSSELSTVTEALVATEHRSFEGSDDSSSIDWQPQVGAVAESAESSDSEGDMILEDEEPDTMIKKKKSSKERDKGLALRGRINQVAAEQSDIAGPNLDVQKQKVGPEIARPTPKKARKAQAPSGLVPGWRKAVDVLFKPTGTGIRCTSRPPSSMVSTSSTVSCQAASATPFSRPGASTTVPIRQATSKSSTASRNGPEPSVGPDDDPAFAFGGLPSDEEVGPGDDTRLVNNHRSITRVDEIHTSPVRAKVRRRAGSTGSGRHRVKNSDLPPGTTDLFASKVLPLALETAGVLDPWECPHDNDIIDIWNLVCGSQNGHRIAIGDVKGDLFLTVKSLVKRAISAWLHRFATAAEKALIAEFDSRRITTNEGRATFVQFLLGDAEDILSKQRPFLWKTAYDLCEDTDMPDPNRFQGLFQGRLVTRTFLEHILAIRNIDKDAKLPNRPIGALIMSIQAVHRVLLYSREGSFKPPRSKSGAFSKANWGDYEVASQRGGVTTVKRASVFLKRIQGLKDQQWDDIYKIALENHEAAKLVDSAEEGGSGTSDDDELLDPLYDEVPACN